MKIKICSIVCVICLFFSSALALTSCNSDAAVGIVSVDSEHITMTAADGRTEVSFRVMRVDTAIN